MPHNFKDQIEQLPMLGPFFLAICLAIWGAYHKFFIIPMFSKWEIKDCPNDQKVADLFDKNTERDKKIDIILIQNGEIRGALDSMQNTLNMLVGKH